MKQRIAVVGGTNFVGQKICATLSASDSAMPLAADYVLRDTGFGQYPRHILKHDRGTWDHLINESDALISCTAGSPASIVASMQALIGALQRQPRPLRVVHISSMTVYGEATGLVGESHSPVGELSEYAAARLEAERIAATHPHVVTLRPGCEFGPDCPHWSERVAQWLIARRLGDLGAAGDGYCNLTYIDDLTQAASRATQLPGIEGEAFNIAMGLPVTWNDYFIRFALALRAIPVRRVTQRRLKIETRLLAPPLKIAELVAARIGMRRSPLPPAIPPSLLKLCRQEILLDVRRAEQRLGIVWTSLDEGLRITASRAWRMH